MLALSNAHIVNIKNKNNKDFIFAAKDGCMNDGARGVYHFSPVRNSYGKIIGYSFTDTSTVEYPYNEFHANEKIANIAKYVGLQCRGKNSEYGDKIVQRRAEQNQYIGDLYDECH